jgi:hypothetical protein
MVSFRKIVATSRWFLQPSYALRRRSIILSTELVPELVQSFPLRNPLHGLYFLVRPITDSLVAEAANRTIQGVVHLELLRNTGGYSNPIPRLIRLVELQAVGIDPMNLPQFVMLERLSISAKYLPSAHLTHLGVVHYLENKETSLLEVQFVLSDIPLSTRS